MTPKTISKLSDLYYDNKYIARKLKKIIRENVEVDKEIRITTSQMVFFSSAQPHFDIKIIYRIGEDDKEDREGKLPGPEVDTGPDNALPLPAANLSRSSSALKAFKV